VGALMPCSASRRRRSLEQGAGGCSAEQSRGLVCAAQSRAIQEQVRLNLGILSGGRVRVCMGQMGWQKMGQTTHVIFFVLLFSSLFWACIIRLYFYNFLYLHISKVSPRLTPYHLKDKKVVCRLESPYHLKNYDVGQPPAPIQ
jgi:hypothetical protein